MPAHLIFLRWWAVIVDIDLPTDCHRKIWYFSSNSREFNCNNTHLSIGCWIHHTFSAGCLQQQCPLGKYRFGPVTGIPSSSSVAVSKKGELNKPLYESSTKQWEFGTSMISTYLHISPQFPWCFHEWYTYPHEKSEKYEFVHWDDGIPNISGIIESCSSHHQPAIHHITIYDP